jgi:hypothetical protein
MPVGSIANVSEQYVGLKVEVVVQFPNTEFGAAASNPNVATELVVPEFVVLNNGFKLPTETLLTDPPKLDQFAPFQYLGMLLVLF